ncbi:MAG: hypothetical protein COB67_00155 [SAR324 cluster bacterium]|uniref:PABS domain-containing protein n=1 Tax=SAR324 cluster bacterium TaxID=2024889 RepID=A0A2A4TC24_9DELT|nr:MAG: hypothetical protein COB67_00155 [SAR324 cluster bacterium]
MKISHVYAIAIIEGIVSLGIEVSAFRQITPFLGSSLEITTMILSFFLIALAFGYKVGGQFKGDIYRRLSYNFVLVLLFAPIALSYKVMALWFSIDINIWLQFTIWLLATVGYPIFLLGQTIPILSSQSSFKTHSEASGNILFYSTLGSVIGAIGVSAFLFNTLGVGMTLVVIGVLITAMTGILFIYTEERFIPIATIAALSMVFMLNIKTTFVVQNAYANVSIAQTVDKRLYFKVNNNASSTIHKDGKPARYMEAIRNALEVEISNNSKVLVVGAGGYTLSHLYNKFDVTYVEINRDLKAAAEKYFLKKPVVGKVIHEDARAYFIKTDTMYDAILLDAYNGNFEVPAHMMSVEFFKNVKEHLNKNGIILVNMIVDPFFNDTFSSTFRNSLNVGIGSCTYVTNQLRSGMGTVMAMCKPDMQTKVYTDDLNKVSLDMSERKFMAMQVVKSRK